MKHLPFRLHTLAALCVAMGASSSVQAAGFNLLEQNVSGLGNAYAGSAAIAENASTIYFNPAGMSLLPGTEFSAGITAIKPSFKFTDKGSTGPAGMPATGNNGGDAGKWAALPNLYVSHQLTPKWHVGLGLGAPFGLTTDYDKGWKGRYHSEKFAIESINVNPSVAYKVNEQLSIGVGANWFRIDADYRLATPRVIPTMGVFDMDTRVKMNGDAWGWNAGILYQATPSTRLGLSYRSQIKVTADGSTKLKNRDIPVMPAGADIARFDAKSTIKLPDTAVFSIVHDLNPKWTLLGDVSWTGWSSIPKLTIENRGPGAQNSELDLRFKDAWRIAVGANYHHNEQWTFKGGVAWDQSPVRQDNFRPTSLPDNDRYWLSIGAQYRMNKNMTWDVGYTHLFLKNTKINNDTNIPERGLTRGTYKNSGDILGVQFSYRF